MKKILTIIAFIFLYSCSNNDNKVELQNSGSIVQDEMLSSPNGGGATGGGNDSSR